jgi:hypothetical protein
MEIEGMSTVLDGVVIQAWRTGDGRHHALIRLDRTGKSVTRQERAQVVTPAPVLAGTRVSVWKRQDGGWSLA